MGGVETASLLARCLTAYAGRSGTLKRTECSPPAFGRQFLLSWLAHTDPKARSTGSPRKCFSVGAHLTSSPLRDKDLTSMDLTLQILSTLSTSMRLEFKSQRPRRQARAHSLTDFEGVRCHNPRKQTPKSKLPQGALLCFPDSSPADVRHQRSRLNRLLIRRM